LSESERGAALWFNRAVGPVDSFEWRVIETFLGDYRGGDLPCFPCLCEIPAGFSGAVNAPLDCDEAVASAQSLAKRYHERRVPLSLAVLTGQELAEPDVALMRKLLAQGGAVVSHSVRHAPQWGGSYEAASVEADESRAWLERRLPESAPVRYA